MQKADSEKVISHLGLYKAQRAFSDSTMNRSGIIAVAPSPLSIRSSAQMGFVSPPCHLTQEAL